MAVADNRGDAADFRQLTRSALRVASGYNNLCLRIFAVNAAYEGACSTVGVGRDAASVYDDNVCCGKICRGMKPASAQPSRNSLSVGAAGPASKVLDMVFCHVV
jgi:hypothetical protein